MSGATLLAVGSLAMGPRLPVARAAAPVVPRSRATAPVASASFMKGIGSLFGGASGVAPLPTNFVDTAPSWETLRARWEEQASAEEQKFRSLLASGRDERACHLASRRLFDLPAGEEPRLTLYRDTAGWCPYSEKVWLALEEKQVPYTVEKVNMNCYGEKPPSFWQMQPSGGIPVAVLDGAIIRESNDILLAIERAFPELRPLLPTESDAAYARVNPLLRLERELFSAWFRWLTSSQ